MNLQVRPSPTATLSCTVLERYGTFGESKKKVIKTKKKIQTAKFINFRPERPLEVVLNILYGTDEIEYVVERIERSQDDDRISGSDEVYRTTGAARMG